MVACGPSVLMGVKPHDRVYITMPLYHTAAGIMGIGSTILAGATSVIRKKFSASRFWEECVEHECTVRNSFVLFSTFHILIMIHPSVG